MDTQGALGSYLIFMTKVLPTSRDLPNSNHLLLLRTAVRRSWTAEICSGGSMNRKKMSLQHV